MKSVDIDQNIETLNDNIPTQSNIETKSQMSVPSNNIKIANLSVIGKQKDVKFNAFTNKSAQISY